MSDGPELPALFTIVPLIFLVVGVGVVARTVWAVVRERRFGRDAASAGGEVTDVREHRRHHNSERGGSRTVITYAPVVRFALPDGRVVDAEVYERRSSAPPVGSRVAVRYDAADPTRCRIDGGDAGRWGAHAFQVVFGLFFVVFSLFFLGVTRLIDGL